ncbi:19780_t:CDS:2 [Cetraspora pellucida]|uniref:19780_t:CDS:1 n=1 Tax=Cetraspora pellucida TaxID=1433469 RepID=A0A9N9N6D1_9GLOM|nr:19780_t:CDS:2 [Cetraspora pellucida]
MAKQTQVPASQIIELVRQPRGPPPLLQTKEAFSKTSSGIIIFIKSKARMDKIELKVDKISQMTSQFRKMMLDNKKPIIMRMKKVDIIKKRINGMLHLSQKKNQEKESKSNEWFLSLQYLHCNINDLLITNSFLDNISEFGKVNDATINTLRWKADKPFDFAIKATENFAYINNGEPEPMLCLGITWIRKATEINKLEQQVLDMYNDVSKIIHRYTDDIKNALMVINSYLHKGEFIVFDLDRPKNDPLAIWLRFNTSLDLQKEIELQQMRKIKNILSAEPTS